ncbi:MAG: TolC family protein [Fimbriimonas sp.]
MNKGFVPLLLLAATSCLAQTPPIKPQTPDIKVPPPIVLPGPNDPNVVVGRQPLAVEEAVAIALQRQVTIRAARAGIEAAAGRTQQSKSDLLSQFSANAGISDERRFRGQSGGAPNRFSASVGVDQLLFDFGRTRTQVRQQEALERVSRFALERELQEVSLQTRLAYYNLVESIQAVTVSDSNLASRQRQYALAEARVESGLGSPADYVRAKTNLAESVLSLENARQSAIEDRVTLADQMGVDPRTPITPAETPLQSLTTLPSSPDPALLNTFVEEALKQRPEMAEAQQRLVAAGLGVAVAKLSNAPSVNLSGNVSTRGSDDPFQTSTGTLGVFLSWRFIDGGFTAGRTREARAQEEQAKAGLEDTSQLVINEVSRNLAAAISARNRVTLAEAQVANARELVRISEGRYRGEIGQFLEISDAQSSLFSAERNLNQAISDARRADARLQRALGRK